MRAETIPTAASPTANFPPIRCAAARSAPRGRRSIKLRQSEEIGDDAFHQIEEELDRAELSAQA